MITRSQAIRRFRIMWRWHSKNPRAQKTDFPGWKANGGKYKDAPNDCFLCYFDCCPIAWPAGDCMKHNSLYMKWENLENAKESKKRSSLAKKISELPVRRLKRSKK